MTRPRMRGRSRAVLLAPLTVLTLLATALPAFAHHPEVTGSASCRANGDVQVDWEAVSWVTDGTPRGSNSDIQVGYREDGGAWQALASGVFSPGNGQSFGSGDSGYAPLVYALADAKPSAVQFRVRAVDDWGNGQDGGQVRTSGSITLPTDCVGGATPVAPSVTVSQGCGVADSMVVATTTGVIYQLGGTGEDVSGETITGPVSGTVTATAAPGYTLGNHASWSFPYELAGAEPCVSDVQVLQYCLDDAGTVAIQVETNTDEEFTATLGGSTVDVVDGEATFEGLEDGTYTVTVRDSAGEVVHEQPVTVDCDEPIVTVQTCTPDGALAVTITDVPDDWFQVTVDGGALDAPIVEDGISEDGSLTVYFDVPDGEYTVTVEHDGPWSDVQQVTVDCDEPEVEVAQECVADGGTVTVTVDETPGEQFTATIGDATVGVVDGVATFGAVVDGTHTVTVRDSEGQVVHEQQVTVDCDEPEVEVAQECVADGGTVTVTVDETPDGESFTVTVDGQSQVTTGGTVTFEGIDDGTHTVSVVSDQGHDESTEVVVDCAETDVGGEEVVTPTPTPTPTPAPAPTPAPVPAPTPPATGQLPATGADTGTLAVLALATLGLGLSLVAGSRPAGRGAVGRRR